MTLSTPSTGHAPGLPALTRRSLLGATPALVAPGLLASTALAETVVPDGFDLSTTEGRIAAACHWFDLTPPTLTYDPDEPGELLFTDEFAKWLQIAQVSLDWLFEGDPKGALAAYRKERLAEQEFVEAIRRLDEEELNLLKAAMVQIVDGEVAAEDLMEAYKAGLVELRAKRALAAA